MLPEQRRRQIVEYVLARDAATIVELSERFSISSATVHRDLEQLEEQGLLRKVRGGVTARASQVFETSVHLRARHCSAEKRAIAEFALRYVTEGMSLMMDNSTTVLALARLLATMNDLTVVTYFEEAIWELSQPGFHTRVISTGGELNRTHHTLVGPAVEQYLARIHVDVAFISTPAIDPALGIMHQYHDECRRKQLILDAADEVILLADHEKFQRKALHIVAPLNRLARIVTDCPLPLSIARAITDQGVDLQVAGLASPANTPAATPDLC